MHIRQLLHFVAVAAALTVLPGAKSGCGSEEAKTTLASPVQAVTTVLQREGGVVDAELVLVSTAKTPHVFVDTADAVRLRVPGGTEVTLQLEEAGHYRASGGDLSYAAGETYRLGFELEDDDAALDASGGTFVAVADAPDDEWSAGLAVPPEFAGDTARVEWSPASRYAIVTVAHEGGATWRNFDFRDPEFDGSKWARLKKGGKLELGVDVFAEPGAYNVEICVVSKVSDFDTALSSDLGALSGFLIGQCGAPIPVAVE